MPSTKEIKRRIKSIRSTKKITKAMELVAASKMKRSVSAALASRLYAEYSWEILNSIGRNLGEIQHPLFGDSGKKEGKVQADKTLFVLITSNRGLCGAYNSQVAKKALAMLRKENGAMDIVAVGKKGDMMMRRIGGQVIASFFDFPTNPSVSEIAPLSELLVREYLQGSYKKVVVAYTDFLSALSQKPNIRQIIPISKASLKDLIEEIGEARSAESPDTIKTEYVFEGDKHALIASLAEKITRTQVYQMILESGASEQSARMMAMKNASEAAGEMIDDLTLVFNKARQANITREISEISAGMASVS